mgnify:FL=1
MRLILAVPVVLAAGAVCAQEMPFSGVYGSPAACAAYDLGGTEAVMRGGTDATGADMPIEIEEDDGFVLLEPSTLTTGGLSCWLTEIEGPRVTFDCSDGEPLSATIVIRGNRSIVLDAGDLPFFLRPC